MFLREADGLKKRMRRISLFLAASMTLTFRDRSRGTSHDRRGWIIEPLTKTKDANEQINI